MLNRFIQPDSIVPNPYNPQAYNRYSYVYNRPINFNDPTGHDPWWCPNSGCVTKWVKEQEKNVFSWTKNVKIKPKVDVPNGILTPQPDINPMPTGTPTQPVQQSPLTNTDNSGSTITPTATVCPTLAPSQVDCQGYPALPNVYYTYEGSIIPIFGLAVDVGGMIVDGASIVGTLFGPPGILASAKAQFAYSTVEFVWSGFMQATGQYEAVYDHTASLLDSNTARYTDSQEMVPIAGFTSSFVSALNNIQVILNGFVPHSLP